jgi:hypothetical protein
MAAISFNGVLVIGLVAVAVPAGCGMWPGLPVPGAVLEVIAGVVIGPSVLGWVHADAAVRVLATRPWHVAVSRRLERSRSASRPHRRPLWRLASMPSCAARRAVRRLGARSR